MGIKMLIKLNQPGMTSLHKVGLAGLYMTLRAFEDRNEKIDGLDWSLRPSEIELNWYSPDGPKAAFEKLIERSFWLDRRGFIRLTGLERGREPSIDQQYFLYSALLNSFLQYGKHRTVRNKQILSYEVDEKLNWIKEFAPIIDFKHQKASDDFIDSSGYFQQNIKVKGWLYPGGSQRHAVYANTYLEEPVELALALLFAPVGSIYFNIQSRAKGRKARVALLLPEIKDLETYSEIRQFFASKGGFDLTAGSTSDAALRLQLTIATNRTSNDLANLNNAPLTCRVITLGIVSWNEKQKSRTQARSILSGPLPGLANYHLATAIFKNRWQRVQADRNRKGEVTKPEHYFVTTFVAREMIADNLAQGKPWYHNLAAYMSNKEIRNQLLYEQKEMSMMVEKSTYDNERELKFIRICHESWRRRLGKLSERARSENSAFRTLVRKEAEKLRVVISRSKNADTLRETVVDFWARAGFIAELQGDGLKQLLPLFEEASWRKARDLALLALISYQPQNEEEKEALSITTGEENTNE
jgi:CRISPR-associated protein Cas8a1/Csx13